MSNNAKPKMDDIESSEHQELTNPYAKECKEAHRVTEDGLNYSKRGDFLDDLSHFMTQFFKLLFIFKNSFYDWLNSLKNKSKLRRLKLYVTFVFISVSHDS